MEIDDNMPTCDNYVTLLKLENEKEIVERMPHIFSSPNKNMPSTSLESYPSNVFPPPKEIAPLSTQQKQSDGDSILSDISELTGRLSAMRPITDPEEKAEEPRMIPLPFRALQETALAPKRRSGVRFSTVHIREYERILGDNPSCTCGPSVGIGWRYSEEELLSVSDWESWRETERMPNRLILSREVREELLLDLGYTDKEIAAAVRDVIKSKNKRRQTIQNLRVSGLEETVEGAKKRAKGLLKFGRKKKKRSTFVPSENQKRTSRGTNLTNFLNDTKIESLGCKFGNKYHDTVADEDSSSFLDHTVRMKLEPQSEDVRWDPRNTATRTSDDVSCGCRNFARMSSDEEVSHPSDEKVDSCFG